MNQLLRQLPLGMTVLIAAGTLSSCCPSNQFVGDGAIEDRGCWPFSNYVARFAQRLLNQASTSSYHIVRLPNLAAVAGLEATPPTGITCEQLKQDAGFNGVVSIDIHKANGETLVRHAGPISDWVWSYSPTPAPQECFVYSRDLYFEAGLTNITFSFEVSEPGQVPIALVPTIKSYAVYSP